MTRRAARGQVGPAVPSGRRGVLAAAGLGAAAALLAGCGFELRRAPALRFRTIQLKGFAPRSPLAAELKAGIDASAARVVESADQAQVILEAIADAREKSVVATSAAAQVREFQLRVRFRFRVRTPAGQELIPESEILLRRDMSYTENAALAKEREEALLYRAMQSDIAAQVLRRLASIQAG